MKTWTVVLTARAEEDLNEMEERLSLVASPTTAARYIDRLEAYLQTFTHAPERGRRRPDLGPGIRTTNFEGKLDIVFAVDDGVVRVLRTSGSGRPVETLLRER